MFIVYVLIKSSTLKFFMVTHLFFIYFISNGIRLKHVHAEIKYLRIINP